MGAGGGSLLLQASQDGRLKPISGRSPPKGRRPALPGDALQLPRRTALAAWRPETPPPAHGPAQRGQVSMAARRQHRLRVSRPAPALPAPRPGGLSGDERPSTPADAGRRSVGVVSVASPSVGRQIQRMNPDLLGGEPSRRPMASFTISCCPSAGPVLLHAITDPRQGRAGSLRGWAARRPPASPCFR